MAGIDPVQHWLSSARADLRAARTMFKGGHWRHVVFLCHLAIEKAIKALIQKQTNRLPPKIHDLLVLLAATKAGLPGELGAFMGRLVGLSIPTRYPDDLRRSAVTFNRRFAEECLRLAARVLRWFAQAAR